jgi:hypothetical protein
VSVIEALIDLLLEVIDSEQFPGALLVVGLLLALSVSGGCQLRCSVEPRPSALPAEAP